MYHAENATRHQIEIYSTATYHRHKALAESIEYFHKSGINYFYVLVGLVIQLLISFSLLVSTPSLRTAMSQLSVTSPYV